MTLSNKRILILEKWGKSPFLIMSIIVLFLFSCEHEKIEEPIIGSTPDTTDVCVIVYMAAENSMSNVVNYQTHETFVDKDINEMISAASQIPLSNKLVIYVDDTTPQPMLYEINSQQGKAILDTRIEENSADPVTFETVLKQITTLYASRRYALVLWSHGSGWIPGPNKSFGIDNQTNSLVNIGSEMNISDMRLALERLNLHFDYIMFDACFMQCIETAYELRKHTDYIIASPAEIPGDGAPYDKIMSYLMNPSEANCINVVNKYFDAYRNGDGAVLSLIKTSELDSLLNITKQLCPDFYTDAYNLETNEIQPYCNYIRQSGWKPEYFDMSSVMYKMLSFSDYNLWNEQLARTVINKQTNNKWFSIYSNYNFWPYIIDPDHLALTSIFVPNEKYSLNTYYNEAIKQTLWYKNYTSKE